MNKIWEKKNLGLPVTLLVLIAYFIGYSFAFNLYNLLVALLFGGFVFSLDFDEKVKTAVKQSYTISLLFYLVNFIVIILNSISMIFNNYAANFYSSDMTNKFSLRAFFYNANNFANGFLNIVAVIVFACFIIMTILKKDIKINFILNILGEGTPKKPKMPKPPVYQQVPNMYQQPFMQQQIPPASPQQNQAAFCPICGAALKQGAAFCSNCGNKI
jgi:hypothetical protein